MLNHKNTVENQPTLVSRIKESAHLRVLAAAILSALTWFLWAYWANREFPDQALTAGLFQGGVSFLTTAFGTALLEYLYAYFAKSTIGSVIAVVIVSSVSLVFMLSVHWFANTPNLLLTVLPVYSVVVLYCSFYAYGLTKITSKYETNEMAGS